MAGVVNPPRRKGLCAHAQFVYGCVACEYVDIAESQIEDVAEQRKWKEAVKQAEERLGFEGLSNAQKQQYTNALDTAREYLQTCEDNLEGLLAKAESLLAEVEAVCNKHPQESWQQAFQDLVESKAEELYAPFRRAFPDDDQAGKFVPEGHSAQRAFEGLDRSKIPATPDSLISEGVGLETYLFAARNLGPRVEGVATPRLPTTAVGEKFTPTFMSTGRAIKMFGLPEDPGDDEPPKIDEMAALSVALKDCDLSDCNVGPAQLTTLTEARTEREFREQNERLAKTSSTLSEEDQWMKFDKKRFMNRTELLAGEYYGLAMKKGPKTSAETGADEATPAANPSPWPAVEEPDFAGFTNWIAACERTDNKFGAVTMAQWARDRKQAQAAVQEQLDQVPPFDDRTLGLGSAAEFYDGEPILQTTLRELGKRSVKKK
ncbi:hypothetical protein KC361_g2354 [Hortaea werneckii]|nr:hypothetical protein KC361_g2354 [Hortaea werneckii]